MPSPLDELVALLADPPELAPRAQSLAQELADQIQSTVLVRALLLAKERERRSDHASHRAHLSIVP